MKHISVLLSALLLITACAGCSQVDNQVEDTVNNSNTSLSENSNNSKSENSDVEASKPKQPASHLIVDFPVIGQLPELPTGCEITAMTMVLNYYNLDADKITMATEYLPTSYYYINYENNRPIGNDIDNYFLGDPTTVYGYVCGTGAIITATDNYLKDCKSTLAARDITGSSSDELYALVAQDTPIVVWTTIEMADRNQAEGWYTEKGNYVDWSTNDHCNVLIGYTESTVTIADPLVGQVEYDREQFEKVFDSRGSKCVILQTKE